MPNTQSAKKALRQSQRRYKHNKTKKRDLRGAIKDFRKTVDATDLVLWVDRHVTIPLEITVEPVNRLFICLILFYQLDLTNSECFPAFQMNGGTGADKEDEEYYYYLFHRRGTPVFLFVQYG